MDNWYKLQHEDQVDSPALLVYPARIRKNVDVAISMIGDINRLRPHVKTHKTKEILKLQMDAGIYKFKCATIAEAEMLGQMGVKDVLLAYPIQGPKIQKLVDLIIKHPETQFSTTIDNQTSAQLLSDFAIQYNTRIRVYIDLDLGMGRTGILPGQGALDLYREASHLRGLELVGLHAYDGHVREIDLGLRKNICDENFLGVSEMLSVLAGEAAPEIIIGGSPSFPIYSKYPNVECGPGTFVLWDKGYLDTLPEQEFLPAAVLLCRVISLPGKDRICVDLGYKAVASENPLDQRVFFLNASGLKPIFHSEEHLVLEVPEKNNWKIGDTLYVLPYHICPTVALYDKLIVIEDGVQKAQWTVVGRDRT